MKRVFHLLLTLVALISVLSVAVFAAEATDAVPEGLVYTVADDGVTVTDYTGTAAEVVIPDTIEGKPVTAIGEWAFESCEQLEQIHIPDSVTTIGNSAFWLCTGLKEVRIPDGITEITNYLFYNCSSLTQINIPAGVTSIGKNAFSWCKSLTQIVIPDGVTFIGDSAFSGCDSLTQIVIPDGVTSIGENAFGMCTGLTQVQLPDSITEIGGKTFLYCSNLTQINIPKGITEIPPSMFAGCTNLLIVDIPEGVWKIGDGAFSDCSNLSVLFFPTTLQKVEKSTFNDCNPYVHIFDRSDNAGRIHVWDTMQLFKYMDFSFWHTNVTETEPFVVAKTCVETYWRCSICNGIIYGIENSEGEHAFTCEVTTAPTRTTYGELTRSCEKCPVTYKTQLPKITTVSYTYTVVTEPTIHAPGLGRYTWNNTEYGTVSFDITLEQLQYTLGDLNADGSINDDDVILLLWHTLLPDLYSIDGEADFTGDGNVNDEDVIYLLWHTLLPDLYPL